MRPKELIDMLAKTIAAREPVLIKGAPGIGKTDIVTTAANNAAADLIVTHPVVSDPTDAKGLPAIVNGNAEFLPFGDLRKMMTAKKLTVVLLDDLGQAPAVVQAAYMHLLLAREINGKKISEKVVFIACTNRREDRAGVTGILEPVKSRFATIVELEPNIDDWCMWALANNVPAELVAYVRFQPDGMTNPGAPSNDIINRPSPRTVTALGRLYSLGLESLDVLTGAAGSGFATGFIGFIKVWRSLPSIDAILMTPDRAPVPTEPSALFAIATALASRVTRDNASRVVKYLSRLPDEYSTLGIRDGLRKCPTAANTREFIAWTTQHPDILL